MWIFIFKEHLILFSELEQVLFLRKGVREELWN